MPEVPRWSIAWALAVTQTVGYGVLFYTYTVMTLPMEAELGLSRSQTSGAFSVGLLLSGLVAAPIGRLIDARGARALMGVGSASGAALVLAWSYVDGLTMLYVVQAGIGLVMAAVLYDVAFTVIAKHFAHHRMRAMLIVTVVAGLASTIFVPLATWLVEAHGWREALRYLAAVLAVVCVPLHAVALRKTRGERAAARVSRTARVERGAAPASTPSASVPADRGVPAPTDGSIDARTALRMGSFWWVAIAFTLDRLAIVAIAAHSVPLLLERGYPPAAVAAAVGAIGLLQIAGRLLFAPASGRGSLRELTAATFTIRVAALTSLLFVPGLIGLWVFAALFGAANGASTLARAGLVADKFGTANYGAINGLMSTLIATVQTAGPVAVGAIRVATGSYQLPLYLLIGVGALATVAVLKDGSTAREALPLVRR